MPSEVIAKSFIPKSIPTTHPDFSSLIGSKSVTHIVTKYLPEAFYETKAEIIRPSTFLDILHLIKPNLGS